MVPIEFWGFCLYSCTQAMWVLIHLPLHSPPSSQSFFPNPDSFFLPSSESVSTRREVLKARSKCVRPFRSRSLGTGVLAVGGTCGTRCDFSLHLMARFLFIHHLILFAFEAYVINGRSDGIFPVLKGISFYSHTQT